MNNNRKKLFVTVAVIVVLGLLGLAVLLRPHTTPIGQRIDVPSNFQTITAYGDRSIVFSNDRSFIRYDYTTGTTAQLSPDNINSGLANIDSLSASNDGKYLLFHAEQVAGGSQLESILTRQQLPTTSDYWWLYSISDQSFKPLPSGILQAIFDGDRIDGLSVNGGGSGETITSYQLSDLSSIGNINIPNSSNFWAYKDGYLLQLADENVAYTQDGIVTQTYFQNMTLLGVVPQDNVAIASTGKDTNRQLVRLDLRNKSQKVIANHLAEPGVVAPASGSVLYITNSGTDSTPDNHYTSYDVTTGKKTVWSLDSSAAKLANDLTAPLVTLLEPDVALGMTATNGYYLVGTNLQTVKSITSYDQHFDVAGTDIHVVYDNSTDSLLIIGASSLALQAQAFPATVQHLKQDGYNADFYRLTFDDGEF